MAGANGLSSKSGPSRAKGQTLMKTAPRVARLFTSSGEKFQVAGSYKLYATRESANFAANKVAVAAKKQKLTKDAAKARAKAPVAKLNTPRGTRYQVPGSFKLYKSQSAAQKVAGAKAAKPILQKRAAAGR